MKTIAAIKIAQKQLGLDDETYRAKLRVITGKTSSKDMTESERLRVLDQLRREGYRPAERRPNGRLKLDGKFAPKLQALWIAGYSLGIVRDRDDKALVAFVERQTGLSHVRFLQHAEDAAKAIEALKSWLAREAGVDWSLAEPIPLHHRADGYKIARAQWEILNPRAEGNKNRLFLLAVKGLLGEAIGVREPTPAEWIEVMNVWGPQVRAARKDDGRQ